MASHSIQISEPPAARFPFPDARIAWLWLLVRVYVGRAWLNAGWEKINNPAWVGPSAPNAVATGGGVRAPRAACSAGPAAPSGIMILTT